jgi:hypothetical protein
VKALTGLGRLLFLADSLAFLPAAPIYADCSNPTGNEKDIIYNEDYHTYEFCDGTQWISMGKPSPDTTDANGDGPNDSADWSAVNYFNGNYIYWTGYRRPRTDSSWADTPSGGGYQCKTTNPWDSGTKNAKGVYGHSTFYE